jgi:hypothetical protein
MAEAKRLTGLHEPERELRRPVEALIEEAVARRDRGCAQLPDRLGAEPKLAAAGCEHAIRLGDRACGADAASGWSFQVPRDHPIRIEIELRSGVGDQRSVEDRASAHRRQHDREGHPEQPFQQAGRLEPRQAGIGDRLWHADVEIEAEGLRDLLIEDLAQAAMRRIDAAYQLALVEAEADRVVGLPLARLPSRPLSGHDLR